MPPIPLLALADRPVAAARLFTPRISFLPEHDAEASLAQLLSAPRAAAPVTMGEQDFDVWYDGAPDQVEQRTAANEYNARIAFWLLQPRLAFWRIKARPSSASKAEA